LSAKAVVGSKPWHILVHEQLFKQQRFKQTQWINTGSNKHRQNEDDKTDSKIYNVSGANR